MSDAIDLLEDGLDDVEDLRDPRYEEDRLERIAKRIRELRSRYPLKLTKDECMALKAGDRDTWMFYRRESDQDGKYEVAEDPANALAPWDTEARRAVLEGRPCPRCKDTKSVTLLCRGTVTNFYFLRTFGCECIGFRDFQKMLAKRLPERLCKFSLSSLSWSDKSSLSRARQEKEIAFLRAHPDDSYFFLGKPGTSKTTYSAALYIHALWTAFRKPDPTNSQYALKYLWRVDGNHLFDSEVAYAMADDKESVQRDVTVDQILWPRKNDHRPVLVLEEIDKRKMTEFAANVLFRLVDAMDECGGQLIVTTNRTMQGFRDMFLKSDVEQVRVTGEALLRRLTDPDRINVRNYHKEN